MRPVTAPQQGLVQHLDHGQRPGDHVRVSPEQQRVALGVLQDLEVLALERLIQPPPDLGAVNDPEGHELEDGTVARRHLGQGPSADQQGHAARSDVLAGGEAQDPLLQLAQVHAVLRAARGGRRRRAGGGAAAR